MILGVSWGGGAQWDGSDFDIGIFFYKELKKNQMLYCNCLKSS